MPCLFHSNVCTNQSQAPPGSLKSLSDFLIEQKPVDKFDAASSMTPEHLIQPPDLSKLKFTQLLTLKVVVERSDVGSTIEELCELRGLSPSPLRRALAAMMIDKYIWRQLTPHPIPGLKGSYRYYPAPGLSLELVEAAVGKVSKSHAAPPSMTPKEAPEHSLPKKHAVEGSPRHASLQLPLNSSSTRSQEIAQNTMNETFSAQPTLQSPTPVDWVRIFLEKLPQFDPLWTSEAQESWREAVKFSVKLGQEMNAQMKELGGETSHRPFAGNAGASPLS